MEDIKKDFLNSIKLYEEIKASKKQKGLSRAKNKMLDIYNNGNFFVGHYTIGYHIDQNIDIKHQDVSDLYIYNITIGYNVITFITDIENIEGYEMDVLDQVGRLIGDSIEDTDMEGVEQHPDLYLTVDSDIVLYHGSILSFQKL